MKLTPPKVVKELRFSHICNNSNATVMKQLLSLRPNTNGVLWGCLRDSDASAHSHNGRSEVAKIGEDGRNVD